MQKEIIVYSDHVIYWCIILIPFSAAIAPAPISVFMGLLIASFLLKKALKRERIIPKTPVNMPLFLFIAVTCLSLVNTVNFTDSLKGGILRLMLYVFLFFATADSLKDETHLRRIMLSITAGLLLVSVDGIWQVVTGYSFIRRDYPPVINLGLVRATSSFKDSNTLGIYLSAFAPVLFGLTLYHFKGAKRVVFALFSLIVLAGTALTYSRPTLLAVYLSVFFLAAVKKSKALIVFLLALGLLSPFILPKSVKEWAKAVEYNPIRFMCNDDRIAVYLTSLNMIKAHPVIGVGAGAFMKSYKEFKEFPEYRNVVTLDEMKAHNIYLHMAGEIGLAGFGAFVWLLYRLFAKSRSIYGKFKEGYCREVSLLLIICLIAFLVNGLTESSLYYSRVGLIFWYLAGIMSGLERLA